ncbi:hypothetical protein, partial [Lacticigenium naphthae]|uniref:hypothetical protein n=1 Tax=Lacticigenium naphthae TaxID=515351 RepID=UPI001B7FD6E7
LEVTHKRADRPTFEENIGEVAGNTQNRSTSNSIRFEVTHKQPNRSTFEESTAEVAEITSVQATSNNPSLLNLLKMPATTHLPDRFSCYVTLQERLVDCR